MKKVAGIAALAASLGGALGVALALFGPPGLPRPAISAAAPVPVWTEVAWPFPIDQWGKGKAFRCTAANCGTEIDIYLRAKIGFCNCTTGVADDDDLDRMGDLALVGTASPRGAGRPINVAWMKGRARAYTLDPRRTLISVVYNERCDMIAATALLHHDRPEATEPRVIEFLNGDRVMRWAEVTLGL
jgi:hypothetical protein